MLQTGIVTRTEGESVWVEVNHKERGDGEPLMACCSDASTYIEARNPHGLAVQAGDSVDLYSSSRSIAVSALMGFGVPLLGFFLAFFLAGAVLGINGDAGKAGLGFAGLVLGSLVSVVYFRFNKPGDGRPVVRLR